MECEIPTHARSPSFGGCFFDGAQQNTDSASQSETSEASFTMYCVEESHAPNSLYVQSDTYFMQIGEDMNEVSDTIAEDDEDESDDEYDDDDKVDDSSDDGNESDDDSKTELKQNSNTDDMTDVHVEDVVARNGRGESVRWADIISDSDDDYWEPSLGYAGQLQTDPDEFIDEWDVWYDSPKTNLSKKGMFRDEFEGSLRCLARIRSFRDMNNLFQQFGERMELIPVDGTVAVCRLGVKPVWEDASHSDGGRLKIRKFPHDLSEVSFRKLLNAFVRRELPFYEYLTCVSLQVKSQIPSQKTDVLQIWHSRFTSRAMSSQLAKKIRSLLSSEPHGYNAQPLEIYELENHTAVARNDVKLSEAGLAPKITSKQKQGKTNDPAFIALTSRSNKHTVSQYGTHNQPIRSHQHNHAHESSWSMKSKKKKPSRNTDTYSYAEKKPKWREYNQRSGQRASAHNKPNKCLSSEVISCDTDTPVANNGRKLMPFNSHKWTGENPEKEQYYESRGAKGRNGGGFNSFGNKSHTRANAKQEMPRRKDKKQWSQTDGTRETIEPPGYYLYGCWYPMPKGKQQ